MYFKKSRSYPRTALNTLINYIKKRLLTRHPGYKNYMLSTAKAYLRVIDFLYISKRSRT